MKEKLILVADSSEYTLTLLHQVLRRFGYDVVLASTAEEAVSQARKHSPDLVLLDARMSGDVLARLQRCNRTAAPPVVALTNGPTTQLELHPHATGFCGALSKRPVRLQPLLDTVRRSIAGSEAALSTVRFRAVHPPLCRTFNAA